MMNGRMINFDCWVDDATDNELTLMMERINQEKKKRGDRQKEKNLKDMIHAIKIFLKAGCEISDEIKFSFFCEDCYQKTDALMSVMDLLNEIVQYYHGESME